jgi:cell division initiation protein
MKEEMHMITPLDIENKKFSKQLMNGYNADEVDEFLDELTVEYEKLYKENATLKSSADELNSDMGKYKNIEQSLQNTLIMAQKTADEIQAVAKQQAENIVKEAELRSQEIAEDTSKQLLMKEKELVDLKKQFDVYKAKMESLLIGQLELIKDIGE